MLAVDEDDEFVRTDGSTDPLQFVVDAPDGALLAALTPYRSDAAAEPVGYLVPGQLDMEDLPLKVVNSTFGNVMDFAC